MNRKRWYLARATPFHYSTVSSAQFSLVSSLASSVPSFQQSLSSALSCGIVDTTWGGYGSGAVVCGFFPLPHFFMIVHAFFNSPSVFGVLSWFRKRLNLADFSCTPASSECEAFPAHHPRGTSHQSAKQFLILRCPRQSFFRPSPNAESLRDVHAFLFRRGLSFPVHFGISGPNMRGCVLRGADHTTGIGPVRVFPRLALLPPAARAKPVFLVRG